MSARTNAHLNLQGSEEDVFLNIDLLTDWMTYHAKHYDILSTRQEGFRRGKGTARQLLMMQDVLSNANLFGEDIYLYVTGPTSLPSIQ